MRDWRGKLYGFTGLYILIGIWTPVFWFVSSMRLSLPTESFDVREMPPLMVLVFLVLVAATLVAQLGFMLMANDHAKYERGQTNRPAQ